MHWNGGPESVYTFLDYAKSVCRKSDRDYIAARFCQIVGNYFGGNLSFGLSAVTRDKIKEAGGVDNGAYVVNADTLAVTERWFEELIDLPDSVDLPGSPRKPHEEGVTFRREFHSLTKAEIAAERKAARAHDYNKGRKLFNEIKKVNDPFFKKDHDETVVVTLRQAA
jgi:hypothetical protein